MILSNIVYLLQIYEGLRQNSGRCELREKISVIFIAEAEAGDKLLHGKNRVENILRKNHCACFLVSFRHQPFPVHGF